MDDYVESDASIAAAQPRPRVAPPAGMAARLGQVLAWTANTIAVFGLVIGTVMIFANLDNFTTWFTWLVAILVIVPVIWGIGRALRYVLAGT